MLTGLAGISFAMSAQLAMLDASTLSWLGHFSPKPLRSTLKGWLVAGLPGLVWFAPDFSRACFQEWRLRCLPRLCW